jgi:hypothetical protein
MFHYFWRTPLELKLIRTKCRTKKSKCLHLVKQAFGFVGLLGQEFSDFFFQVLAGVLMGDPAGAVE